MMPSRYPKRSGALSTHDSDGRIILATGRGADHVTFTVAGIPVEGGDVTRVIYDAEVSEAGHGCVDCA
jgi:hypothetical protein